jgi:co-chaperonin GroES (HSP10)
MAIELIKDNLNVIDLTEIGVSLQAVEDKIIILVDSYKSGFECKTCKGEGRVPSPLNAEVLRVCDECKGKGSILVIPDTAKSMPSTGVVVSMGPNTEYMTIKRRLRRLPPPIDNDKEEYEKELKEELDECLIKIGTRVVFGVHVGTKIPIKGNIKLTIMREKEPLCIIFGSEIGDKEIIDYSAPEYT